MNEKLPWITTVLLTLVCCLLIFFFINLRKELFVCKNKNQDILVNSQKLDLAFRKSQELALNYRDKIIYFSGISPFYPKDVKLPQKGLRLVVVFDEVSCNVCAEAEANFAKKVADVFGEVKSILIIRALERRYASAFVRLQQPNYPVFLCEEDLFFEQNEINNSPISLLIDENDRVIAANCPIPGQDNWSQPFRNFVINRLFANQK